MKKIFLTAACLLLVSSQAFSAKQTITSTDTGAQSRTKLNANFTELYDGKSDKTAVVRYWSDWPTTGPNNVLAVNTIVGYEGKFYKVTQEITKTGSTADPETLTAYFSEIGKVTAADLGLGTSDNPSFNSVHASGGNLAAANKQVTKAWQTGLSYTAGVTSVIHGGQHYIAKTTHEAGSTTEPGVGANWSTAWAPTGGSLAWTDGKAYYIDDFVTYSGVIYKCVTNHTSAAGNAPGVGAQWESWQSGSEGSTNISVIAGASSVAINSSSGTDATMSGASTIAAGVMTASDKSKLDGIATGATANSADATLLNRANHTGTQVASTISDFASTVNTVLATPLSKLSGIATGAEVNVQADWNQATNTADDYIKNKPVVFTVDSDQTITGEKTFEDIILPLFDTMEFNDQSPEPGCAAGEYKIYFTSTKARQCINGTASDIGSGGSMTYPGAGIPNSTGSAWGTSYTLDADLSSTSSNDDTIPSAKAVRTALDGLSASSVPSVTATPADAATGAVWYNSTANEFCVAESAGISCVAMTYTADDNDPSNSTPWFTDEVDIALSANKISNAITLAGLGARGAAISVTGSTGAGYSKNSGPCTSSAGRVYSDPIPDTVAACVTASGTNNTATTATVTVGTDSDTYSVTTAAASVSYLINQNFEGTGYDNSETWVDAGTPDENYTTTALRGSQSFYAASGANNAVFTLPASKGELWAHVIYRVTGTFNTDSVHIIQFQDSSNNQLALVGIQDTSYNVRFWQSGNSGTNLDTTISANTTYHLWVRVVKGATSTVEVWNGTTTTRPTSASPSYGTSTGTWNVDVAKIRIGQGLTSGAAVIIDQVIIDDESFTTVD